MNKWKALCLGLLFLTLAIYAWANGGWIVSCWLLPFVLWFLPQGVWKFYRDWAIISQAKQERQQALERQAARPQLPPMTSPAAIAYSYRHRAASRKDLICHSYQNRISLL